MRRRSVPHCGRLREGLAVAGYSLRLGALLLVLALGPRPAAGQGCPARAWPGAQWPSRIGQVAVERAAAVAALEAYAFALSGQDEERLGVRTDALLIVDGGTLIYERYGRGFGPETPHLAWSVTKSALNLMAGVAVHAGQLELGRSLCDYRPGAGGSACAIRVRDLLEFASGLDWAETYEGQSNQASSVLAMLYGQGRRDMADFVLGHARRDPPGTTFMYSSGDANLLAAVVGAALRPLHGEQWPWAVLFDPLGMTSAVLERDGAGTYVGSSYLYATPRDLARLGYLALADGCWDGQRLLPAAWIAESTAVSAAFRARPLATEPGDVQGRMWWLNQAVPEQGVSTPWPAAPPDAFAALGHWGQSLTIIPSLDLLVVRLADDRDGTFDRNRLLELALAVAR